MIFGHKYNLFGNKIFKKYKNILDKSTIYSYIFIHRSFSTGVKYSLKMVTTIESYYDHLQMLELIFTVHSFLTFTILFFL